MKLAHIVNPILAGSGSDLRVAQPITFESMRIARELAKLDRIEVDLLCTVYPEDTAAVPDGFRRIRDLERSVLDVAHFLVPRKLPLVADIISRALAVPHWDYLVYTNVDIAVLPYFYSSICGYVRQGVDAFTITRRTISARWTDPRDLSRMYSQIGTAHPGYDCFVFGRDSAQQYLLDEVCVGAPLVGRAMLINMISHARRFEVFPDEHLTFHLGDERAWADSRFDDYIDHNMHACASLVDQLRTQGRLAAHPVVREFERNASNRAHWIGGGSSIRARILSGVGRILRVEAPV